MVVRNRAGSPGLAEVAERSGVELVVRDWIAGRAAEADLVISAVPAAAAEALAPWAQRWPPGTGLFDLVYAPWPTVLADAARRAGARVLGGLELLVHQAVGQIELMTGRDDRRGRAAGRRRTGTRRALTRRRAFKRRCPDADAGRRLNLLARYRWRTRILPCAAFRGGARAMPLPAESAGSTHTP